MNLRRAAFPFLLVVVMALVACGDRGSNRRQTTAQPPIPTASPTAPAATPPPPATAGVAPQPVIRDPAFTSLAGATADFGIYQGAAYRIEMPTSWNGGLVMYAHGYRGDEPAVSVSNPEIRASLIAAGYAWAASSYRENGYRPDLGIDDTAALRDLVIQKYGQPRWTILYGSSMGGHVVTGSLELRPGLYQGALAECGALTGIGVIDYLAAYGAAAEYIGGVPLFDAPDARTFIRRVTSDWLPAIGFAQSPTERGLAFQSVAKFLIGGDLPYWREGLAARLTQALNLLLLADPNRERVPAARAVDTRAVTYRIDPGLGFTAEELNRNVRRFAPIGGARSTAENPVFAEFTGKITVPLLTIHTTGDAFVPFSVEQEYRRLAQAAGAGNLLVQRGVRRPGHCQFENSERMQAFTDLVAWVERGIKPQGDDVLAADPSSLGLRWTTPLRPDDPARR